MDRVDEWLDREFETSPQNLAAYRIVYSLVAMVLFWNRGMWTIGCPDDFWSPPLGVPMLFAGPPPEWLVWWLNGLLMVTLALLLVGYRVSLISLAVAGLMVAVNSISYSYAKIDHDILMVAIPFTLAFSGWGSTSAVTRPWCLNALAVCIGLAMLTAGLPKLCWLNTDHSDTLGWAAIYNGHLGWKGIASGTTEALPAWFWETLDWGTVAIECGMILTVVRRRWFQFACVVACWFHLGILLMLDLPFASNVVAYAAFFPMAAATRRWYLWFPLCALLTRVICPWHGGQEFASQLVVVSGAVLLPTLFLPSLLTKVPPPRDT